MSIVTDAQLDNGDMLVVEKLPGDANQPTYQISVAGVVRYPRCSADDAIRALGYYIHSLSQPLEDLNAKPDTDTLAQ